MGSALRVGAVTRALHVRCLTIFSQPPGGAGAIVHYFSMSESRGDDHTGPWWSLE